MKEANLNEIRRVQEQRREVDLRRFALISELNGLNAQHDRLTKDLFSLVKGCDHKYPDGSDAVTMKNMDCCEICGWDKHV